MRNPGTGRNALITRSINLDFPNTLAQSQNQQVVGPAFLGLTPGDYDPTSAIYATPRGGLEAGLTTGPHWVSGSDLVIAICNVTLVPIDPAARDWTIVLINQLPGFVRNVTSGAPAIVTRTATLDFPSVANLSSEFLTLTPAALGVPAGVWGPDAAVAAVPVSDGLLPAGMAPGPHSLAANGDLSIGVTNYSGGPLDPPQMEWAISVFPLRSGI